MNAAALLVGTWCAIAGVILVWAGAGDMKEGPVLFFAGVCCIALGLTWAYLGVVR